MDELVKLQQSKDLADIELFLDFFNVGSFRTKNEKRRKKSGASFRYSGVLHRCRRSVWKTEPAALRDHSARNLWREEGYHPPPKGTQRA